jgi:hypothetical protein
MLSQLALSDAVQAQPLAAVTVTLALPPVGGKLTLDGDTEKVHGTPACVMVTVRPAAVNVVLRAVVDMFAVAVNDTVPLPDPLAPLVMLSQLTLSEAVQAQPLAAVTEMLALPPAAARLWLVGATE